tara:strand:- start:2434 stop:3561 length:1128 start_codon:yes stop_codon:yes gene_type:complete
MLSHEITNRRIKMNSAHTMYNVSLNQAKEAILHGGKTTTIILQGHMGSGKSSLLAELSKELPDHIPCYFDCTTKDLGDIGVPKIATLGDNSYVSFAINEEFGIHHGKPVIIMLDEYGKANPAVKNAVLRLIQERAIGSYELHPDSLIFATTNLGSEGIGDLVPPHARNRVTVLTLRKSTNLEWIEWGINNGIEPIILGVCKDNPSWFQGFEEIKDPSDNPYIYHPREQRAAFVTPRSLAKASDWLKLRYVLDDHSITALLIGTIGARAAMDLMAFLKLADQLPTMDSIKKDPMSAKVPSSSGAVCMVVYRALANLSADWINPWMDYLTRLDKEAQGLFANGACKPKYIHQKLTMTNRKFTEWAIENSYMFAADKV